MNQFRVPGYTAIVAAALTLPMIVLGITLDILARKNPSVAGAILIPYLLVAIAQILCGLYAFGRFKTYLNQRHDFHDVDTLIIVIIIGSCLLSLIGIAARVSLVTLGVMKASVIAYLILIASVGIPLAILTIVFGVKLLRLQTGSGSLIRPFAYLTIAASVCFATFILAPVGLALDAAGNVVLGLVFLRREPDPPMPEFV